MNKELLHRKIDDLTTVRSRERHRIYADIVDHALSSPQNLVESLTELDDIEHSYAKNARTKVRERIRERFQKGEDPPGVEEMKFIVSQSTGLYQTEVFDAFHGYMDRPVKTLDPTKMTAQSFVDAAMEATKIAGSFAQALTEEEDPEKLRRIMSMWQELYSPDVPDFTINDILGYYTRTHDGSDIAGAARSIINSMEVMYLGEFDFNIQSIDEGALFSKLDAFSALFPRATELRHPKVDQIEHTAVMPQAEGFRRNQFGFAVCTTEPESSEIENTALYWILKKWEKLTKSDDGHSNMLSLPGRYQMLIMNRGVKTPEEEYEIVNNVLHEAVADIRRKEKHGEQIFPVTETELDTLLSYGFPDIKSENWRNNINDLKNDAAGGLYSLSKRGDRIVFDPEHEKDFTDLGLESLTLQKQGAQIVAELRVLGTPIRFYLDSEYSIDFDEDMSSKSQAWISSIIYSYLSELRNNMATPVSGPDEEGSEYPPREREVKGVRPHLRVLAERYKATITSETNNRVRSLFGHSLSEMNYYLGMVQMRREFLDELPPKLQRMIGNLLSRIETKGVEPYWVDNPEPLMLLGNPQSGEDYDPLTSVFRVAFVEEHEVEDTEPKDVHCKGAIEKIHTLVGRQSTE